MDTPSQEEYEKFLDFCGVSLKGENPKFLDLIKSRYAACDESFRCSGEMVKLLEKTRSNMATEESRKFVHLKEFLMKLKINTAAKWKKKKKKRKHSSDSETEMTPTAKVLKLKDCSVVVTKFPEDDVALYNEATNTMDTDDSTEIVKKACSIADGAVNNALNIIIADDEQVNMLREELGSCGAYHNESPTSEPSFSGRANSTGREAIDRRNSISDSCSSSSHIPFSTTRKSPRKPIVYLDVDGDDFAEDDQIGTGSADSSDYDDHVTSQESEKWQTDNDNNPDIQISPNECIDVSIKNEPPKKKSTSIVEFKLSDSPDVLIILPLSSCQTVKEFSDTKNIEKQTTQQENSDCAVTVCSEMESSHNVHLDTISVDSLSPSSVPGGKDNTSSAFEAVLEEIPFHESVEQASLLNSIEPKKIASVQTTLTIEQQDGVSNVDKVTPSYEETIHENQKGIHNKDNVMSEVESSTDKLFKRVPLLRITTENSCGSSSSDVNPFSNSFGKQEKAAQKPSSSPETKVCPSSVGDRPPESGDSADEFQKADDHILDKNQLKQKRRVSKLEQLLESLRDEIEKCQDAEMTLDDLDDDNAAYIYEDKLKRKFVAVWNKLCEVTGRTVTTGRPTEKRVRYSGTRYQEINRRIEKFLNKKKEFPDFHDIKSIVKLTNKKCNLNLSGVMVDGIAQEAFVDIGEMLQTRRHQDFVATFGTRQTDVLRTSADPYLTDPEFRKKVDTNRQVAKCNLDNVIAKYSKLQQERFYDEDGEEPEEESDEDDDEISRKAEKKNSEKQERNKNAESIAVLEDVVTAESIEVDMAEESDDDMVSRSSSVISETPRQLVSKYNPAVLSLGRSAYLLTPDKGSSTNSRILGIDAVKSVNHSVPVNASSSASSGPELTTLGSKEDDASCNKDSIIVIDESPAKSQQELKKIGLFTDIIHPFSLDKEGNSIKAAESDSEKGNGKDIGATDKRGPNIKYTARKPLPSDLFEKPKFDRDLEKSRIGSVCEIFDDDEDEDQSSDSTSEQDADDKSIDDDVDEIVKITNESESEGDSVSSREPSPISVVSLSSESLDDLTDNWEKDESPAGEPATTLPVCTVDGLSSSLKASNKQSQLPKDENFEKFQFLEAMGIHKSENEATAAGGFTDKVLHGKNTNIPVRQTVETGEITTASQNHTLTYVKITLTNEHGKESTLAHDRYLSPVSRISQDSDDCIIIQDTPRKANEVDMEEVNLLATGESHDSIKKTLDLHSSTQESCAAGKDQILLAKVRANKISNKIHQELSLDRKEASATDKKITLTIGQQKKSTVESVSSQDRHTSSVNRISEDSNDCIIIQDTPRTARDVLNTKVDLVATEGGSQCSIKKTSDLQSSTEESCTGGKDEVILINLPANKISSEIPQELSVHRTEAYVTDKHITTTDAQKKTSDIESVQFQDRRTPSASRISEDSNDCIIILDTPRTARDVGTKVKLVATEGGSHDHAMLTKSPAKRSPNESSTKIHQELNVRRKEVSDFGKKIALTDKQQTQSTVENLVQDRRTSSVNRISEDSDDCIIILDNPRTASEEDMEEDQLLAAVGESHDSIKKTHLQLLTEESCSAGNDQVMLTKLPADITPSGSSTEIHQEFLVHGKEASATDEKSPDTEEVLSNTEMFNQEAMETAFPEATAELNGSGIAEKLQSLNSLLRKISASTTGSCMLQDMPTGSADNNDSVLEKIPEDSIGTTEADVTESVCGDEKDTNKSPGVQDSDMLTDCSQTDICITEVCSIESESSRVSGEQNWDAPSGGKTGECLNETSSSHADAVQSQFAARNKGAAISMESGVRDSYDQDCSSHSRSPSALSQPDLSLCVDMTPTDDKYNSTTATVTGETSSLFQRSTSLTGGDSQDSCVVILETCQEDVQEPHGSNSRSTSPEPSLTFEPKSSSSFCHLQDKAADTAANHNELKDSEVRQNDAGEKKPVCPPSTDNCHINNSIPVQVISSTAEDHLITEKPDNTFIIDLCESTGISVICSEHTKAEVTACITKQEVNTNVDNMQEKHAVEDKASKCGLQPKIAILETPGQAAYEKTNIETPTKVNNENTNTEMPQKSEITNIETLNKVAYENTSKQSCKNVSQDLLKSQERTDLEDVADSVTDSSPHIDHYVQENTLGDSSDGSCGNYDLAQESLHHDGSSDDGRSFVAWQEQDNENGQNGEGNIHADGIENTGNNARSDDSTGVNASADHLGNNEGNINSNENDKEIVQTDSIGNIVDSIYADSVSDAGRTVQSDGSNEENVHTTNDGNNKGNVHSNEKDSEHVDINNEGNVPSVGIDRENADNDGEDVDTGSVGNNEKNVPNNSIGYDQQNVHNVSNDEEIVHSVINDGGNVHSVSNDGENVHSDSNDGGNVHSVSNDGGNVHSVSNDGGNVHSDSNDGGNVHSVGNENIINTGSDGNKAECVHASTVGNNGENVPVESNGGHIQSDSTGNIGTNIQADGVGNNGGIIVQNNVLIDSVGINVENVQSDSVGNDGTNVQAGDGNCGDNVEGDSVGNDGTNVQVGGRNNENNVQSVNVGLNEENVQSDSVGNNGTHVQVGDGNKGDNAQTDGRNNGENVRAGGGNNGETISADGVGNSEENVQADGVGNNGYNAQSGVVGNNGTNIHIDNSCENVHSDCIRNNEENVLIDSVGINEGNVQGDSVGNIGTHVQADSVGNNGNDILVNSVRNNGDDSSYDTVKMNDGNKIMDSTGEENSKLCDDIAKDENSLFCRSSENDNGGVSHNLEILMTHSEDKNVDEKIIKVVENEENGKDQEESIQSFDESKKTSGDLLVEDGDRDNRDDESVDLLSTGSPICDAELEDQEAGDSQNTLGETEQSKSTTEPADLVTEGEKKSVLKRRDLGANSGDGHTEQKDLDANSGDGHTEQKDLDANSRGGHTKQKDLDANSRGGHTEQTDLDANRDEHSEQKDLDANDEDASTLGQENLNRSESGNTSTQLDLHTNSGDGFTEQKDLNIDNRSEQELEHADLNTDDRDGMSDAEQSPRIVLDYQSVRSLDTASAQVEECIKGTSGNDIVTESIGDIEKLPKSTLSNKVEDSSNEEGTAGGCDEEEAAVADANDVNSSELDSLRECQNNDNNTKNEEKGEPATKHTEKDDSSTHVESGSPDDDEVKIIEELSSVKGVRRSDNSKEHDRRLVDQLLLDIGLGSSKDARLSKDAKPSTGSSAEKVLLSESEKGSDMCDSVKSQQGIHESDDSSKLPPEKDTGLLTTNSLCHSSVLSVECEEVDEVEQSPSSTSVQDPDSVELQPKVQNRKRPYHETELGLESVKNAEQNSEEQLAGVKDSACGPVMDVEILPQFKKSKMVDHDLIASVISDVLAEFPLGGSTRKFPSSKVKQPQPTGNKTTEISELVVGVDDDDDDDVVIMEESSSTNTVNQSIFPVALHKNRNNGSAAFRQQSSVNAPLGRGISSSAGQQPYRRHPAAQTYSNPSHVGQNVPSTSFQYQPQMASNNGRRFAFGPKNRSPAFMRNKNLTSTMINNQNRALSRERVTTPQSLPRLSPRVPIPSIQPDRASELARTPPRLAPGGPASFVNNQVQLSTSGHIRSPTVGHDRSPTVGISRSPIGHIRSPAPGHSGIPFRPQLPTMPMSRKRTYMSSMASSPTNRLPSGVAFRGSGRQASYPNQPSSGVLPNTGRQRSQGLLPSQRPQTHQFQQGPRPNTINSRVKQQGGTNRVEIVVGDSDDEGEFNSTSSGPRIVSVSSLSTSAIPDASPGGPSQVPSRRTEAQPHRQSRDVIVIPD